jgi:hypothetical protein
MGDRRFEELDQRLRAGAVLGDRPEGAGTENRLAEILVGIGRHVEEVRVDTDLGAFREEGRDEGGLVVHVALRRR